jgi:putative DNA primase/helicase
VKETTNIAKLVETEEADAAPTFSEEDLALRFKARHVDGLRYVAAWNRWLSFDGTKWNFDDTRETWSLARQLCREVATTVNKPKDAKAIASAKTRAAVVSLAGEDRALAATVGQWDADPWLLNTPGGVVDLRTGQLRKHRLDDYMTKCAAVTPDGDCPTPIWDAFLTRATNSDAELQSYLIRVSGYGLTGITDEHAMFFNYGEGGNGKGVYMRTLTGIANDYARVTPIETFTDSSMDRHPTELAALRGARIVTSVETEEGRRWAESKIKALTGGDTISARFMRQDFFDYRPQFKLMISGNHKPSLRSVDEAIRRRMNLIPWNVVIPEAERDIRLGEKLRPEWPGILARMIEGCIEWQRIGLAPPKAVVDATDQYLGAEDLFTQWLEDCCIVGPSEWAPFDSLFGCWQEWMETHGEHSGTARRFSQKLDMKFRREKHAGRRGFVGLTIFKPADEKGFRQQLWEPPL